MSDAVALYPRGQKISDAFAGTHLLGAQTHFEDLDLSAVGVKTRLSASQVQATLVKYTGGSTLAAGSICKWGVPGQSVAANAGADEIGCGIVDPDINSAVQPNEYFWLITKGPVKVLSSAAIAANASVKAAASGKAVTTTVADTANMRSAFGKAIEAASGADELKRVLVDFRDI